MVKNRFISSIPQKVTEMDHELSHKETTINSEKINSRKTMEPPILQ